MAQSKEERRKRAEMELLIGDTGDKEEDVEVLGMDDERFDTRDKDFAIDPTSNQYRKVTQGHNKIQKRQKKW